jgi:hypothetical protein
MSKIKMKTLALLAGVLAGGSGCLELDVTNTQQPDRDRALAQPKDVESLIGGAFNIHFRAMADRWEIMPVWLNIGPEATSTLPWWATVQVTAEPREPFNNASTVPDFTGPRSPRILWADMNEIASNVHDGLRSIAAGTRFMEGTQDQTPRAHAFAKFMQGVAWGTLAMLYDQVYIIPETEPLSTDFTRQVLESLTPYAQARDRALQSFDAAIALGQQHNFTYPDFPTSRLWFGTMTPVTSQEFVRLANTMAARFLVLNARTPAERQQVDWQRVLQYTANGLTTDFDAALGAGFRNSSLMWGVQTGTPGFSSPHRLGYRLIGPADISGQYQAWINAPVADRRRFDIVTPDRRITGVNPDGSPNPRAAGAYTRYRATDTGFNPADGLYRFSAYQWARNAYRFSLPDGNYTIGAVTMVYADENRLLRAEALLRTGNPAAAAELINVTRTRPQRVPGATGPLPGGLFPGLPPVTADGVPVSPTCVPRTDDGRCGDLLVALRYERMLELVYSDFVRGYADARGFGMLPAGTWLHQPIPGNELELLGLPEYTFGGVGTQWGAVYNPVGSGQ